MFIFEFGILNGEIRNYILEVFGWNVFEGLLIICEVFGFELFIEYVLCVYVCIDGGCVVGLSMICRILVGVFIGFFVFFFVEINVIIVILEWDELG